MTRITKATIILLIILLNPSVIFGQGTAADYTRADSLESWFKGKVYYATLTPVWAGDSNAFIYTNLTPDGKEFILVNPVKNEKSKAFDNKKLALAMAGISKKEIDIKNLPIKKVVFKEDLKTFTFIWNDIEWECKLPSYKLISGDKTTNNEGRRRGGWAWGGRDETANESTESPDGVWTAYIKDYNVFIRNRDKQEYQLSFDGGIGEFYSSYIRWSPNSKKLMAYRVRPAEKHMINYIESSPENQRQPKLHTYEYAKPGDAISQLYPQLFDIENKEHIVIDASNTPNQYNVGNIKWAKDSHSFTYEYNRRGHQYYSIIKVDSENGNQTPIVEERSETFFHYSGKMYRYDVNDGNEIIWASERDGWNHLYLYDGETGIILNQITKGKWPVRDVEYVDEENRNIIFTASGKEEGDPYLIHYYRINFDGTGLRKLTDGYGQHQASFSPDYTYFVDTWSTIDTAPVSVLRNTLTGSLVMELENADISELQKKGWKSPVVFTSKGRDGVTEIWGAIFKPTNFDPAKKYPVIEYIYAGPHDSFVPKSFRPYYGHIQPLTELGFIVVQIDGMGTANRSKAFHDVCYKNLKDAGFPDRILWIKDAASKFDFLDISNMGIYGTSAGGQSSTGALLFHPDFYKVGVSSCGCHDNRMDKIWWNEQWMGWPVGIEYSESSNIDNADKLKGKLLLINGEMDFNVDPTSTIQLVDALIKANKNVDYIFVPGMGHSSGGKYGEHKRRDFFVKHILGTNPPDWK